MGFSWLRQKRRVERLANRVDGLVEEEHLRREMLKSWTRAYTTRYETVFWAGVTGFVFLSRRRKDRDDRHNLLVELGLAAWVVQRWRRLPRRVEASLDRAREQLRQTGRPRPGAAAAAETPD